MKRYSCDIVAPTSLSVEGICRNTVDHVHAVALALDKSISQVKNISVGLPDRDQSWRFGILLQTKEEEEAKSNTFNSSSHTGPGTTSPTSNIENAGNHPRIGAAAVGGDVARSDIARELVARKKETQTQADGKRLEQMLLGPHLPNC